MPLTNPPFGVQVHALHTDLQAESHRRLMSCSLLVPETSIGQSSNKQSSMLQVEPQTSADKPELSVQLDSESSIQWDID